MSRPPVRNETKPPRCGKGNTMNITLNLAGPAHPSVKIDINRVLANNVIFDGEYNPHNVRLWLISNMHGYVAAVWSSCEQDALDEAVDADLMDSLAIDEADADEDTARLGNAGEPFDLTYCGVCALPQNEMSVGILMAFAEARGAGVNTLDDVACAAMARSKE